MRHFLLLAALLAAPGVRAQVECAPPAGYGLSLENGSWIYRDDTFGPTGRALSAAERERVAGFFASLPADGRDAALAAPLVKGLALVGRDPADTGWFDGDPSADRLSASGRLALTATLLGPTPASAAAAPRGLAAPQVRLGALTSKSSGGGSSVNFDGGAARVEADAVAQPISSSVSPQPRLTPQDLAALPDAPTPHSVPAPMTRGEKAADAAFWTTWWGYHAAWAADFTTTGMVLSRGGYETDPLYTRFGNRNMAGVIGSAVVVHVVLSGASLVLHEEAQKHKGFTRHALEAAAIAMNGAYIGVHASAAAGNVGVLHRMD